VSAGGLRLNVALAGEGEPLLLLHGLMTSSYSWRYVIEPLGRRFRLVMPDLPGCGRTPPAPSRSHSAAALAELVTELQTSMGIEGCAAVGNSLGGYILMQRPAGFSRLVVIHAPAFPYPRLRALALVLRAGGARALSWHVGRNPERWAHSAVHYRDEHLKSLEEAREYGRPLATREGRESFTRYLRESLDPKQMTAFLNRIERFPIPLLLVSAREDPMVKPATGPRLHSLMPGAEFRWIEDSSHFAQVDTPETLAQMLIEFLERKGPGTEAGP
jgi:pimeloyl-ACP methyl ester carboxylesterase